jgi:hypothetical protein
MLKLFGRLKNYFQFWKELEKVQNFKICTIQITIIK